ncbi:MAG: hypothetical protein E4H02_07630 [Lentisphaerales bacterium]|nr:MAG: hypothetical protein E4H02_07630 [Lentisphaerales bacterium]
MTLIMIKHLLAVNEQLEVRGLCDPDKAAIERISAAIGSKPTVYDGHEALVAAPDIDWVMIATWNCLHKEQTVSAFDADKHVFCQKPMATSLDDCLAMVKAWKKSGRLLLSSTRTMCAPRFTRTAMRAYWNAECIFSEQPARCAQMF